MNDKLAFLLAPRFWALVIGCLAILLGPDGVITPESIQNAIMAFSAGFIGVRTLDRSVEYLAPKSVKVEELTINNEI